MIAHAELSSPPFGGIRTFFFDLDGTLADTLRGLEASIQHAFGVAGRRPSTMHIRPFIGPHIRVIFKRLDDGCSETDLDILERAFRSHYDDEGVLLTQMFDGVRELLTMLSGSGAKLYIVTNKPFKATSSLLRQQGLDRRFDRVVSRDSRTPPFTDKGEMLKCLMQECGAEPSSSIMLGDTEEDESAADFAGAIFVHAEYGYGKRANRQSSYIRHPLELLNLCGLEDAAVDRTDQVNDKI